MGQRVARGPGARSGPRATRWPKSVIVHLMCGRFTFALTAEELAEAFGLEQVPSDLSPRYNVAPSQPVLGVTSPVIR